MPAPFGCVGWRDFVKGDGVRRRAAIASAFASPAVQTFLRQSLLLLLVFGLLNASNYAFHVVVSRLLGPSAYGALAALLAVILVLSVPFTVLQTALANQTAALRANGREHEVAGLAADALKTVLPFAWAAGAVVLVVGTPLLSVFLHIGIAPALLLAPYVVASVPLSVAYGVLQGELRFKALGALILVGVALRFALGVTLVVAGLGISGALLGTVLATALTVPLAVYVVRVDRVSWRGATRILHALRADVGTALWGLTAFWVFAEVDVALARHYLSADDAGFYSSAGLMARAPAAHRRGRWGRSVPVVRRRSDERGIPAPLASGQRRGDRGHRCALRRWPRAPEGSPDLRRVPERAFPQRPTCCRSWRRQWPVWRW